MLSFRTQIRVVVGVCLLLVLAYFVLERVDRAPAPTPNPIPVENALDGTDAWRLGSPGFLIADDVTRQIKGYASSPSVRAGEKLDLHVSVDTRQPYTIDVYRIGWYGGAGGRRVFSSGQLDGMPRGACQPDPLTGTIDCAWPVSYTLNTGSDWTTGVYLAVLTNAAHYQNTVVFVVRNDARTPSFLYKQPVNTYQAYNNFPNDRQTGKSLYEFNSFGPPTVAGTPRAVKVSFDRPYADRGTGDFLRWELPLVRWLERNGYDVGYTTDLDFHNATRDQLRRLKGILSVGHDEYWTRSMFDHAEYARDAGVNLAFFGADSVDWQVRYAASKSGGANRVLVCFRDARLDDVSDTRLKTVRWRDPPLFRPEQILVGVQFGAQLSANTDLIVNNDTAWPLTNSGLRSGDRVVGIAGYEVDVSSALYTRPTTRGNAYALLTRSPVVDDQNRPQEANSSIYEAPSGAWVFASGTMSWATALDGDGFDPRVDKTTANLLNTFASGLLPASVALPAPATSYERVIRDAQPLAYWRYAQQTSRGLLDMSGHGLDSSFTAPDAQNSRRGAMSPRLPPLTEFTIEGWTFLDDARSNASDHFNNTLYGTPGKVRLLVRPGAPSTNTLGFFGVTLDGTEYDVQPPAGETANVNQWVYWAFVRTGSRLLVYRNGAPVGERSGVPADAVADVSGTLGVQHDGAYPLSGWVEDVAIYPRALDAATIAQHATATTP